MTHHAFAAGSQRVSLCVGIDPSRALLEASGFPDTPAGLDAFVAQVTEVVEAEQVRVVKPQVAFFERHGLAGMRALAQLLAALRAQGVFVIADAKRGDIGSSVAGYAEAWLTPGGDFEADALTLHPYHGALSLTSAFDIANAHQKTVFVLVATSNPEATPVQSAITSRGDSVAHAILSDLVAYSNQQGFDSRSIGIVVGATVDQARLGLNLELCLDLPILAPGYGAQGAHLRDVDLHFPHAHHVFPVSARALFDGGVSEFPNRYRQAVSDAGSM